MRERVESGAQSSMTLEDAYARLDSYFQKIVEDLPADVETADLVKSDLDCENGPPGTRFASFEAELQSISPMDIEGYFASFIDWGKENGFRVVVDERKGRDGAHRFLSIENKEDGFGIALTKNRLERIFITASSPCIWPDGKAPTVPPEG